MAVQGIVANASAAAMFLSDDQGELPLGELVEQLHANGDGVKRGNLHSLEQMLAAQSVTLNAIFTQLARRACLNMNSARHLGAGETYMRLALKAQSQCRLTIESLATIKNPRMVITKQMNVSNGPQQVNNQARTHTALVHTKSRSKAKRTERLTAHVKENMD